MHPAKRIKSRLVHDASSSAEQSVRRDSRRLIGLMQNEGVLKEVVEKGRQVDSILNAEYWFVIEKILDKAMGLSGFTESMRGKDAKTMLTSAEQYAVVQGIYDDIYNLSERGKAAQIMLNDLERASKEDK